MERDDPTPRGEITLLLSAWRQGDADARDRLMPIVYGELRRRAAAYMRREGAAGTLRPTELVHETYLRLCEQNVGWQNREQFFGVAATLMRRIIVDRARARRAEKRGRGLRVTLGADAAAVPPVDVDVIEVDHALRELAALDQRQARLVELRFFGGLTIREAARALDVSPATAKREWVHAKAWLGRRLQSGSADFSR